MLVLKMVSAIIVCFCWVAIMIKTNIYSSKKYKKEFFTWEYFLAYSFLYATSYYGYDWYIDELKIGGDILNGILIMFFSLITFIVVVIKNIKASSLLFGLFITSLQLVLYFPLSFLGLFALLGLLAFFAQTKPVYNVN